MMVQTTALWGEEKKAAAPKNAWVSSQNTSRVPFPEDAAGELGRRLEGRREATGARAGFCSCGELGGAVAAAGALSGLATRTVMQLGLKGCSWSALELPWCAEVSAASCSAHAATAIPCMLQWSQLLSSSVSGSTHGRQHLLSTNSFTRGCWRLCPRVVCACIPCTYPSAVPARCLALVQLVQLSLQVPLAGPPVSSDGGQGYRCDLASASGTPLSFLKWSVRSCDALADHIGPQRIVSGDAGRQGVGLWGCGAVGLWGCGAVGCAGNERTSFNAISFSPPLSSDAR
ncbi:hypothetical protein T484DRAFT_1958175 [Baffinella frigidus]|nr:hypothetical protein T484DRAFT_1958175 [Cryptophyta sp. CCMP2293]